jgi:hypothetical protein
MFDEDSMNDFIEQCTVQMHNMEDAAVEEVTREYFERQEELAIEMEAALNLNSELQSEKQILVQSIGEIANKAHSIYLEATNALQQAKKHQINELE